MFSFVLNRIALLVPIFFGVTLVSFGFIRMLPGDPVAALAGERDMTPERHAEMMEKLGLDKPVWQQYLDYVWNLLHGDFGTSVLTNRPILDEFMELFPRPNGPVHLDSFFPGVLYGSRLRNSLDFLSGALGVSGLNIFLAILLTFASPLRAVFANAFFPLFNTEGPGTGLGLSCKKSSWFGSIGSAGRGAAAGAGMVTTGTRRCCVISCANICGQACLNVREPDRMSLFSSVGDMLYTPCLPVLMVYTLWEHSSMDFFFVLDLVRVPGPALGSSLSSSARASALA